MNSSELSLQQVTSMMAEHSIQHLYVKILAPNDNSKNQPYFGGGFGVLNVLPTGKPIPSTSGKHNQRIFKASLNFAWLDPNGSIHPAPRAQLILYPQYPEVRFSGYLKGASWGPSEIMGTNRDQGRILILGVRERDGLVIGFAAERESAMAGEIAALQNLEQVGVFLRLPLSDTAGASTENALLRELCRVHARGWIRSRRLSARGIEVPCTSTNCGGFTLEAEFGIIPNGRSAPDYLGWELKSYSVKNLDRPRGGPITLMTPEPTGGFYVTDGVYAFVERFGYADRKGRANRMNFNGAHRVGVRAANTGLTMVLNGYDAEAGKILDTSGALCLRDDDGLVAAEWSYSGLLAHWNRKHAATAFVPVQRSNDDYPQYRFGNQVALANGADFLRVLKSFAEGKCYYDPGIKIERTEMTESSKRRSQFRCGWANLPELYDKWREVRSCD